MRETPACPTRTSSHRPWPRSATPSASCAWCTCWRASRGRAVRVRDIVDQLNADYLDWSFSREVVIAAVVQLQANWLTDYRNSDGIVLSDGPAGPELTIEDSSRVDPWIVRQAERLSIACAERLADLRHRGGWRPA